MDVIHTYACEHFIVNVVQFDPNRALKRNSKVKNLNSYILETSLLLYIPSTGTYHALADYQDFIPNN